MSDVQYSELEVVAEQIEQQQEDQQKSAIEDVIPDEFKGKTASEIAKEALFYRSQMGKQANELGEVRKLADELIKSQLHKPKEQEVSKEIDFFENPQGAMNQAIERNPEVQAAKQFAVQARQEQARLKLLQDHPDALNIVQEGDFNTWINKSKVRQELLNRAHNNFDVDAANELFSNYKELKSAKTVAISDSEKAARKDAVNSAGVDSGGSGEKSKKLYKRTDIMKLMTHDRKKYESMRDEIELAYLEGRVR